MDLKGAKKGDIVNVPLIQHFLCWRLLFSIQHIPSASSFFPKTLVPFPDHPLSQERPLPPYNFS